MAHTEKETYGSYSTDAFDNPPSGPVGVHRGRRSLAVRVAPFVVVIVVAALAGLLAWGIASGELNKVPWPWAQQSAQSDQDRQDDAAADNGDDAQADADAQDDAADQGEADGQDTDGAAQPDDATADEQQPESQPEQTVNYNTSVRVINATGVNGYAAQQSGVLQSVGYTSVIAANPSGGALPSVNVVWYQNETDLATAQNIADTLGIATVEQVTGIADPIVVVYIAAQ
ncbi:LytR C-terminal domain-containing protein [Bifidobacterium pullorum]|uniref:LytR C-terminal domain-containing protein n=1 Tax=Bifidobacterium pullorum TaxID=78448 RepID=UPI00307B1534